MEEKKKHVTNTMQLLGLKPEDMIDFWLKNGILSPLFWENAEQYVNQYEVSIEVHPGWYAFEGYRFSANPDAYPNRQGVVSFIDKNAPKGKRIGVLLPKMVMSTRYHPKAIWLGADDENDGWKNSKLIGVEVDDCNVVGIDKDNIFSPAIRQLEACGLNQDIVNQSLLAIGGDPLYDFIWSSTEVNKDCAYGIYFPNNTPVMTSKLNSFFERRMFLL